MVKGWYRAGRRFESWAVYIYPYRGEIQFSSKFLRALENSKSHRNSNLVRAWAHRLNGRSAWAHERIGPFAHRRFGTGSLNGNRNRKPERERELGTGTGTLNGNGKRNTEKIPTRGEICFEFQFFRYFWNVHKNSALGGVRTWDPSSASPWFDR